MTNNYWNNQFGERAVPHSDQNKDISRDFFQKLNSTFNSMFENSQSIIEIGCGTGEMSKLISDKYNKNILGTDLSPVGIDFANKNYANSLTKFQVLNVLTDAIGETYDLAVCSNILEHFRNPFAVIDKVLSICKYFVILVPYNQPVTDGYDDEGGAGHVFQFTEQSFANYQVIDSFLFKTGGWQHSSAGEDPQQFAIILRGKI